MELTYENVAPDSAYLEDYLRWESQASAPYNRFVYGEEEIAGAVSRAMFAVQSEIGPDYGRLFFDEGGRPVGMAAWLSGAELKNARMSALGALFRVEAFRAHESLRERGKAAAIALTDVAPNDCYLSRLAVSEAQRGNGIGSAMLRQVLASAREAGSSRLVLEASADEAYLLSFYKRNGFLEFDRVEVAHPSTDVRLAYAHLGMRL